MIFPSFPSRVESPQVCLHGGPEGFDNRDWQPIDLADATLFSKSEKGSIAALPSSAIFKLVSPDGDQGFPGNLLLEVLFAISPPVSKQDNHSENRHVGSLYVVYRAKLLSDDKREVTPVNLTQVTLIVFSSNTELITVIFCDWKHWGFNLDASLAKKGNPTPDIKDHQLFIKVCLIARGGVFPVFIYAHNQADHVVALDENSLSTGKLMSVMDTPLAQANTKLRDNYPPSGHGSSLFSGHYVSLLYC